MSPEPTAVGAVSSAIAVHVASRRWLSFFRSSKMMSKKLIPFSSHSIIALVVLSLIVFLKLFLINSNGPFSSEVARHFELLYFLTTAMVCMAWMYGERRKNGESLISLAPLLAATLWPVGMPLYLVFTRKWYGLLKAVIAFVCLSGVAILGAFLGRSS